MRMYDIIKKKRDNLELSKEEIEFFVNQYSCGNIPDYQASALLMAIYFNKMNKDETSCLTLAMARSGDVLDLSSIKGVKVDKHSTGGIGDKVSLIVGPMVAACGVPVAKMAGRGLGFTGGTIDKLESIEGMNTSLSNDKFTKQVNDIGVVISASTADLATADSKLYKLRDVTATVENASLIAASVMSKKIASGADAIVLDVKVGDGAFMKTLSDAKELASIMVEIGNLLHRKTVAIISDMNEPLGFAVGNSLEVIEAINSLKGNGPDDVMEICMEISCQMLLLAGEFDNASDAKAALKKTITSGKAFEKFKELVKYQGGNVDQVINTELLPRASIIHDVKAGKVGFVERIIAEQIGVAT